MQNLSLNKQNESPSLAEQQQDFLRRLSSSETEISPGLNPESGLALRSRFGIYKNGYLARLRAALLSDHSATAAVLREDFSVLADQYARASPSRSASLRDYGNQFPNFLRERALDQFRLSPGLAELALFERTMLDAFDAAEADRLAPDDLRSLQKRSAPVERVNLHPSVRVLSFQHNAVAVWKSSKTGAPLSFKKEISSWLVWRDSRHLTTFRPVKKIEEALLRGLLKNQSIPGLCEELAAVHEVGDVVRSMAQAISQWTQDGMIAKID